MTAWFYLSFPIFTPCQQKPLFAALISAFEKHVEKRGFSFTVTE
jgi:hypothetical protein